MKKILFLSCALLLFIAQVWSDDEEKKTEVREIKPYSYCCVEMTGSYEKHSEAFQMLYEQAGAQGLGMDFAPFGVYYSDPSQVAEAELKWEIGFELAEKAEVKAPLVLKEWPHELMAVALYEGPFSGEAFGLAHQKLSEWIVQNGYSVVGPSMEKYLSMPAQNNDGEWVGTIEIMLPVQKK
ncbi:GyrI-like domain-containing protein [candidate division KSB1 bacterium]|nr:GyrI-like domain-containing protein [candidate division KSB1 bacterium]RQW08801.1 MAG: AraC family transcriptional regulator [candidate division KSB1 bacterium]